MQEKTKCMKNSRVGRFSVILFAPFLLTMLGCGDSDSSVPQPPASPPPDPALDPFIEVFDLPSDVFALNQVVNFPEGSIIVQTPRGLRGPAPRAAFRIVVEEVAEEPGRIFIQSFFQAEDAGCLPDDTVCAATIPPITIGPDADLGQYRIELTVFDQVDASATETRFVNLVEFLPPS